MRRDGRLARGPTETRGRRQQHDVFPCRGVDRDGAEPVDVDRHRQVEHVRVRRHGRIGARGVAQHDADAVGRGERRHARARRPDRPRARTDRAAPEENGRQVAAPADLAHARGGRRGPAPLSRGRARSARASALQSIGLSVPSAADRDRAALRTRRTRAGSSARPASLRGLVATRQHPLAQGP